MDLILSAWDLLVHLDQHLAALLLQHGAWIYLILFAIIFCETGLVVTPFLPGDSLLFVAGALAATGGIDVHLLALVLVIAGVLGNTVNYSIGYFIGPRVFHWEGSRFFNRKALERAHKFYEKHGGVTIIITRFVPILRTFAPFVAGIARMTYLRFSIYNVAGALAKRLVQENALDGAGPGALSVKTLEPDWPRILESLEPATASLQQIFLR